MFTTIETIDLVWMQFFKNYYMYASVSNVFTYIKIIFRLIFLGKLNV